MQEYSGFGINVAGGTDHPYIAGNDGFFVSYIRRDDLVDLFCVGDRIISVNDIIFENKKHLEVVKLLKELDGADRIYQIEDDTYNSNIMKKLSELFFFGIGACAFIGFIFLGYRNFGRRTG